jgi:DNA-binding NarL/FixJ family response regulator
MNYSIPKKIFAVDDDQMLTEALSDYLTRNTAHQISCFATGEECLKHLHENPDIIILDYYLNTVQKDAANGMEVLNAIKKHHGKIHVIMLSSQEQYGIAMQTIQKGAEQYVIKDGDAFANIEKMIEKM